MQIWRSDNTHHNYILELVIKYHCPLLQKRLNKKNAMQIQCILTLSKCLQDQFVTMLDNRQGYMMYKTFLLRGWMDGLTPWWGMVASFLFLVRKKKKNLTNIWICQDCSYMFKFKIIFHQRRFLVMWITIFKINCILMSIKGIWHKGTLISLAKNTWDSSSLRHWVTILLFWAL